MARATNPRRVEMFIAEKGIAGIERVSVDLTAGEHLTERFRALNPLARIPVLELDDGRYLAESRAICSFLEARYPDPNLMGANGEERAFIEMIDRQIEFHLLGSITACVRHTHPAFAALESPQFADHGLAQGQKMKKAAQWLDRQFEEQQYVAGPRFTIADITGYCAIEFARLIKFRPEDEGLSHLAAWRDRVSGRSSARV